MRRRRAQGQRADQQADQQSQIAARPARHHAHAHRIDAGHAGPGNEAQRHHRVGRRLDRQNGGIGRGSGQGAGHEQAPVVDAVGQTQHGAENGADNEAGHHGGRKQRGQKIVEAKFRAQRRHDGRGREPQTQNGDLADGDNGEGAEFAGHSSADPATKKSRRGWAGARSLVTLPVARHHVFATPRAAPGTGRLPGWRPRPRVQARSGKGRTGSAPSQSRAAAAMRSNRRLFAPPISDSSTTVPGWVSVSK